ncbi:zinc-binding dehydrogenase [uncultured Leifsonia sp.]|uniref:zinc-binding dehydrogenase n=1 Tax=uncultured Leifsonia sp. TaxID=340359 RepID=UPI0028D33179|nr:zinc-binding dehydrogenase [uncultured Leifsonia sp.]
MAATGGSTRRSARVVRFGDPSGVVLATEPVRAPRGNDVVVRVTDASLGSTDVLARRGGYVLQPVPGFVTGYDLVGVLETESAVSVALGLRAGMRVAGVLPRMGAHTTRLVVPPTLLVAVPDGLDSASAAVLPLDAVTAALALRLAGPASRILVQGVLGAVGSLAAQLASRAGASVVGTASAPVDGVTTVDYRDPDWPALAVAEAGGAFDAAIDHTGSPRVAEALAPTGVLVHTAFAGRRGHERADTVRGGARAALARHPRERVCSVPLFVLRHRPDYRRMLSGLLADAAEGRLRTFRPQPFALDEVWEAHRAAEAAEPGRKVVVEPRA